MNAPTRNEAIAIAIDNDPFASIVASIRKSDGFGGICYGACAFNDRRAAENWFKFQRGYFCEGSQEIIETGEIGNGHNSADEYAF